MGLMIIKDAFRNKIIWYKFVRHEIISDYMDGIGWLRSHDFNIYGIVVMVSKGCFSNKDLSCSDVSVPSDDDCQKIPYQSAKIAGITGITSDFQYDRSHRQRKFCSNA